MITATALNMRVADERTIHCAACKRSVEAEFSSVQGVRTAKADHETQLIEVNLDNADAVDSLRGGTYLQACPRRADLRGRGLIAGENPEHDRVRPALAAYLTLKR